MGAVAEGLYLAGDNFDADEIRLVQMAYTFLHLYSKQPGPIKPLGDPDAAARSRQEMDFRLFQTLQRARARAEDLRLAMVTRRLEPGQPDFEALWLTMREHYLELLCLRQAATAQTPWQGQVKALIQSMPELESWLPPPGFPLATFPERLRGWEQSCTSLALTVYPQFRQLVGRLSDEMAQRRGQLVSALEVFPQDIQREIESLLRSEDANPAGLLALKTRLKGMQLAVLKALDFALLARVHGIGSRADLEELLRLDQVFRKAIELYEKDIEAVAIHMWMYNRKAYLTGKHGTIHEYRRLSEKIIVPLVGALKSPDSAAGVRLLADLALEAGLRAEKQHAEAALASCTAPAESAAFLNSLAEDPGKSFAAWSEFSYGLHRLETTLAAADQAERARPLAAELQSWLRLIKNTPKEVAPVTDLVAEIQTTNLADAEKRKDLHTAALAALADVQPLARPPQNRSPEVVGDHYQFFMGIDVSALARARVRSRQRMELDRQRIYRLRAALAVKLPGAEVVNLRWTVGEAVLNRHKGELALARNVLGTVGTGSGGPENLKIPKHLYEELQRARSGAMPELFRRRCYDYLNAVLENAR